MLKFLYKLTFHPPLVWLRPPLHNLRMALTRRRWLWRTRNHTRRIAGDVDIRGRADWPRWLQLGDAVVIDKAAILWIAESEATPHDPHLQIGHRSYIGPGVFLGASAPLTIGADCLIGAYSYLITANHEFKNPDIPVRLQGYTHAPITLGRDVWLGCHVVVLPGVTIGDGAVIAAGAVVNQSVPPFEVWGGVPARKLSQRNS